MTKRKIILSGATGFIGQRLSSHLLKAGYHITALYRNENSHRLSGISWVRVGDLAIAPLDPALGRDIDVFINLAATLRSTTDEPSGQHSKNVAIARNVSHFVAEAGIPRVLILSSIAASVAARDPVRARQYGVEKLEADGIFLEKSGKGKHVIIIRPPAVYGQGMQNSLAKLAVILRKGLPIPLGCATEPRHYISVRNICSLIETIIGSGDERWAAVAGRAFEPSDGYAISTRDLICMMGDTLGRRARLLPVPTNLLRALGAVTGHSDLISGAIDRLEVAPIGELETAFGWRPVERMPESLAFLRDPVTLV